MGLVESIGQGFCWENLKESKHLEDLDLDGTVILKRVLKEIGWEGLD
jgi:hypothetical protein